MKNVLTLLKEFEIQPKYVGTYDRGDVYHSACPMSGCSKEDGFHVWPDSNNGQGSWWCRKCDKGGDGIEFLKHFKGYSYKQACDYLGKVGENIYVSSKKEQKKPEFQLKEPVCPVDLWQKKAKILINNCNKSLLKNKKQLLFLETRGISVDSVKKYNLGWNSEDKYRSRKSWGVPKNMKNKNPDSLFIPEGIIIPTIEGDTIYKINIRRGSGNYLPIAGSKTVPKILGKIRRGFVVVESELDGFMLSERIGDLISVFVLGSVKNKPLKGQYEILKSAIRILIALDSGEAPGAKASKWWLENFDNARRWPVPDGKDPGEFYEKYPKDIRQWIIEGLPPFLVFKSSSSGVCLNDFKKGEGQDEEHCPRREKKIINVKDELHEDIKKLFALINKMPIKIIKENGNTSVKETKWFEDQFPEKSCQISALVFSTYCGRYINDHLDDIINYKNFWNGLN